MGSEGRRRSLPGGLRDSRPGNSASAPGSTRGLLVTFWVVLSGGPRFRRGSFPPPDSSRVVIHAWTTNACSAGRLARVPGLVVLLARFCASYLALETSFPEGLLA